MRFLKFQGLKQLTSQIASSSDQFLSAISTKLSVYFGLKLKEQIIACK